MHASTGRARMMIRFFALTLVAGAAVHGLAGCGANPGGAPPVDSPIYQFQPVDPDEYVEDTDDEDDDGTDEADDASED